MTEICRETPTTIQYLRDKNLLKREQYCCQARCREVKGNSSDQLEFKCLICDRRQSIHANSIFANIHIPLRHLLLLVYFFAVKTPVMFVSQYLGRHVGRKAIGKFFKKLRHVMSQHLNRNPIVLGGPNCIVEIDETLIGGVRKFHRGYFRGSGQKWVIGMIDRNTRKAYIEMVPNRTRDTLFPIIQDHILPNSIIHSDEAPVYRTLNQNGYTHYTVCH